MTASRPGPRPLPLHLGIASTTWLSSFAALPLARKGSIAWKSDLAAAAGALYPALAAAPAEALAAALAREAQGRFAAFATGIERYRRHPYRRALSAPPVAWGLGATRLFDYGGSGVPALFVPSLVNRGYVLDLSARSSLLRYLAAHGVRPWLIDWGEPGPAEAQFSLSDYILGRLVPALDRVVAENGGPAVLVGYCMGGNLALAAALARPASVKALALLATPWDFHAERADWARALGANETALRALMAPTGELAVDALQALFFALDPLLAVRKFTAFAALDPASEQAADFVALEDWLNDGVPLTAPVAAECLFGWYGKNTPARGAWRVGEALVDPGLWPGPALLAIPAGDRIVPPASALALAAAWPAARVLKPRAGHIGMVVGRQAKAELWRPLAEWLRGPASP